MGILKHSPAHFIADDISISERRAQTIVDLFEDGAEVAFIARYRTHIVGDLSCQQLRKAFETYKAVSELSKKADKAAETLKSKLNGAELSHALSRLGVAREASDITDVTAAYTTSKRSKADKARELGLEETARAILAGNTVHLQPFVGSNPDLKKLASVEEHVSHSIADLLNRMDDTQEAAKKIVKMEDTRAYLTVIGELSPKAKKLTEKDKDFPLLRHFQEYSSFKKNARTVSDYQILAMMRGEEKGIISWRVDIDRVKPEHPGNKMIVAQKHGHLFRTALDDSIKRLFIPKCQRAIRRFLTARAENSAIDCFSTNLFQLFAAECVSGVHVVALDPGFSACKAAFLEPNGRVVSTAEFGLRGKHLDGRGCLYIEEAAKQAGRKMIIGIGNGKASFETQAAVAAMINSGRLKPCDVKFCVVPENGASKYSITELAEEELPRMPPTQRSAVSIGRRIIDPMAEYVKIDPKHLGMGMYQHSVNEKRLGEALELVVREYVSNRGVDVNKASLQLLEKVCGLNRKLASAIITKRNKDGRITSREKLMDVAGLGDKRFEQCAGFLIVTDDDCKRDKKGEPIRKKRSRGLLSWLMDVVLQRKDDYEPLDATTVHPSQYPIAWSLLSAAGCSVADARNCPRLRTLPDLNDEQKMVRDLLIATPKTIPPPPLMDSVRTSGSLKEGETLSGRIQNQTDFGLFVDIGVENSALAHKSTYADMDPPEVGTTVTVRILNIDHQRGRIGVKIL